MIPLTPTLVTNKIYTFEEVSHYVLHDDNTNDYVRLRVWFPFDPDSGKHSYRLFRPNDEILLRYQLLHTSELSSQIHSLSRDFSSKIEDLNRVQKIADILRDGEMAFPIFIQHNYSHKRIIEGRHRAIAHAVIGSNVIPAFEAGYRAWFENIEQAGPN